MSVNFCARAVTDRLEARLRADPSLATPLAAEHVAIDFDRAPYLARLEEANRPRPLTASVLARVDKLEVEHATCWASLAEKSIERRDLDDTLELHRAYNGLNWGWAGTPAAQLLFDDDGGVQLGDDVGYGRRFVGDGRDREARHRHIRSALPGRLRGATWRRSGRNAPRGIR